MKALKVTYDHFHASLTGSEVAELSAICPQRAGHVDLSAPFLLKSTTVRRCCARGTGYTLLQPPPKPFSEGSSRSKCKKNKRRGLN